MSCGRPGPDLSQRFEHPVKGRGDALAAPTRVLRAGSTRLFTVLESSVIFRFARFLIENHEVASGFNVRHFSLARASDARICWPTRVEPGMSQPPLIWPWGMPRLFEGALTLWDRRYFGVDVMPAGIETSRWSIPTDDSDQPQWLYHC